MIRDHAPMPRDSRMPSWLPAVNRRIVNPVQRLWAPRLPPWALIVHRGRRSGAEFRTPVLAAVDGDRIAIGLLYGSDAQWVRNLLAAGGGEVVRRGRRRRLANPRIVRDARAEPLPRAARLAVRHVPVLVADLD
jgi:deazaflavin-dependent oxidoreductase (nitroreductase family)